MTTDNALQLPANPSTPPWIRVALGLTLLIALAVRAWFAAPGLGGNRFWDERYSFENVHAVVGHRTLVPASGYYPVWNHLPPSAVLCALDWLHRVSGRQELAVFRYPEPHTREATLGTVMHFYTPLAHAVARAFSVLYGVASIFVIFLVGRRLAGPMAGLGAAVLLAMSPWHVRISAEFKPDALVILAMLCALLATVSAFASRPALHRYLRAGVWIALAPSAKLTGGLMAIPLSLGSLVLGWRQRRRILYLIAAGLVAALTFVLLNPRFKVYLWYFGVLDRFYARRARELGHTHLDTFWAALRLPFDRNSFGAVGGVLLIVGAGVLVWIIGRWLRDRRRDPVPAVLAILLLTFPVLYVAAYAYSTAYFKANNLIPSFAFFALWGGVGGAAVVRLLHRRAPVRALPRLAGLAALGVPLLGALPAFDYAYSTMVPTTTQHAARYAAGTLRRAGGPVGSRLVIVDASLAQPGARSFAGDVPTLLVLQGLESLDAQSLDHFDGFIARRELLEEGQGIRRWLARSPPAQGRVFEPRLFRARGPAVVAEVRPQWSLQDVRELEIRQSGTGWSVALPSATDELFAYGVLDCPAAVRDGVAEVTRLPTGQAVQTAWIRSSRGRLKLVTERLPLAATPGLHIRLEGTGGSLADCHAVAALWCRSGTGTAPRSSRAASRTSPIPPSPRRSRIR